MKIRCVALQLAWIASASIALAQLPASAKRAPPTSAESPLIVDVHAAPYRPQIVYTTNVRRGRFDMRNATILEMIQFAFDLGDQDDDRENAAIVGGPNWIDFNRFDISAVIPSLKPGATNPRNPAESADALTRAVIKRVLTNRFHLKYHTEDRPLPGYVITVANGGPKLAQAKDSTAEPTCHGERDNADPAEYTLTCTAETIARFIADFGQIDFPHTVVDRTGLTKPYDFSLHVTLGPQVHTRDDLARIYTEALDKQLGLAVTRGDVPQPAIVVDAVDRTPTPNVPDIAELVPALPGLEFEVASIRLASDSEPQDQIRPAGSQITFYGFNLQGLISRAWQLRTGKMLGDALAKLPSTRFTILVKLPAGIDGRAIYEDQDQLDGMLQKLLIDRFEVKYHWGEWTQADAYVLLAGTPKMKKADPNARSFCKFGPPEGEKTARTAGSPYDGEFHCQNVTMAQFAELTQALTGSEVKNRVPNRTGLTGSYDFWVYFTSSRMLRAQTAAAAQAAKLAGEITPAPVGGLPVEDAFRKQLGLRLEKQPLTQPGLVLDHFDEKPTAN